MPSHTRLKKYIRLLRSELETKSYTLKTVYGNYRLASTLKSINYIALLLSIEKLGGRGGGGGGGRKKPGPKSGKDQTARPLAGGEVLVAVRGRKGAP